MNKKILALFLLLFMGINISIYVFTEETKKSITHHELEDSLKQLQTHYKILLRSQKDISYAIYKSILRNTDVQTLLFDSYDATKELQAKNRNTLMSQLKEQYQTAKKQGVLQMHFVDKNNISFLRMHKPSKFGDDLTHIRQDYKYTNETQKPIRGFVQGRLAHGFRNVFPLFNKENEHIGAMEISFSSDLIQWFLENVSQTHSHFLVNKKIYDEKAWSSEKLVTKYRQSTEAQDYMVILTASHLEGNCINEDGECINQQEQKVVSIKDEITSKLAKNVSFTSYYKTNAKVMLVSFVNIRGIHDETLAWIVSYTYSSTMKEMLRNIFIIRIAGLFVSLLIIYFLIREVQSKQKLRQQADAIQKQYLRFDEILSTTSDIIFITDFQSILFSNERFKKLLYVGGSESNPQIQKDFNILDLFIVAKGFLHKELLEEGEDFVSLMQRVEEKNKVVSLLDENFDPKAFTIHMVHLKDNNDYLITLSDVTGMKEELVAVDKKAYIDGLTQVYNRNMFNEILDKELQRTQRHQYAMSIALIDIDKFKDFNDTYGHLIGDEILISMAQNVNATIRSADTFARWGGEEFILLFPETDITQAEDIALKLKDSIQSAQHPVAGMITASFGVTQYKEGDTVKTLFKRCDEALYLAKENGRNRVEVL